MKEQLLKTGEWVSLANGNIVFRGKVCNYTLVCDTNPPTELVIVNIHKDPPYTVIRKVLSAIEVMSIINMYE